MGLFEHHQQVYNGDQGGNNKGSWTHEVIGGAAAFEAMRAYEKHENRDGAPPNHQKAKEMLAGIAGAEVDKLFETKGLNTFDREKVKREAQQQAVGQYENKYEGGRR